MLHREILKLRSEIAGNAYFSTHFCMFKVFKGATKFHEKGQFARVIEKSGGGARAPCVSPVPTSMTLIQ